MMNSTACTLTRTPHRELKFGSWTVSVDRSPQRIGEQLTDFAVGVRWGAIGAIVGLFAILAAAL